MTEEILISEDGETQVLLSDIHKFTVFHKTYENGLKLKAYVNPDLCTVIDDMGEVIKKGKYEHFQVYEHDKFCAGSRPGSRERISREISNGFIVLGKYNKCRTKLMNKVKKEAKTKQNNSVVMTGMSSGYAVHNSYLELKMNGDNDVKI